jgi:hypothetical protein
MNHASRQRRPPPLADREADAADAREVTFPR